MRSLKIIVTMWIVYASFYLCRVNYSVALPYINSETGITFTSLGVIASGFFILYSIGQVLNGYLGVKYNPWIIIFIGIVGSSISTILFGLSNHFTFFLILWLINGYFQSTGWPSLVKIISFTLSSREMGKGYGIVNTSWALGHVISWLFTGILATYYGWRFGFIINGFIFLLIGMIPAVYLFRFTGDLVIVGTTGKGFPKHKELDGLFSLKWSVATISILSLVYSIEYAVRYALIIYLPSYLYNVEQASMSSIFTMIIFPFSGSLGMLFFGWLFDKLSIYGKTLLMVLLIPIIAFSLNSFPVYYEHVKIAGTLLLAILSFILYGLESQIVSTIPVTIIGRKYSSLATGIINSAGSLGAFVSSIVSGIIIDSQGFHSMFGFWSYMQLIQLTLILVFLATVRKGYSERPKIEG